MSLELEVLDQLLGGDLRLSVIRMIFPDDESFNRAMLGLLKCGDVRLLSQDGSEVLGWRWRDLFALQQENGDPIQQFTAQLTDQGVRTIGY